MAMSTEGFRLVSTKGFSLTLTGKCLPVPNDSRLNDDHGIIHPGVNVRLVHHDGIDADGRDVSAPGSVIPVTVKDLTGRQRHPCDIGGRHDPAHVSRPPVHGAG